jgi:hypothetical protein
MENKQLLKKFISYSLIILLAVIARLVPHPANFVPIGGLALFSGAKFKGKFGFLIPLLAMAISDIFLGFHSTIIYVYASFLIIFIMGKVIKNSQKPGSIFLASLMSSIIFFLVTNFGVWANFSMYPKTISGLYQSYIMGLPFFRNTLLGDLFYSFSFFYGYRFLSNFLLAF